MTDEQWGVQLTAAKRRETTGDKGAGSGRTTGIALGLLGAALRSGGEWCTATDHCPGQEGMQALATAVDVAAKGLSLNVEVKVRPGDNAVMVRTAWVF